jgi:hypothetical protein
MVKNYMSTGTFANSKKPEGESVGKVAAPFLEEKAVMTIYLGLASHESRHQLKLTGWVINAVRAAVREYLC